MNTHTNEAIHLTSRWYLKKGKTEEAISILQKLANDVLENEPNTLTYLVHLPSSSKNLTSLPLNSEREVTFFEIYRDEQAFQDHVNGDTFTRFITQYGYLFEQSEENDAQNKPFHTVSFLNYTAGFARYSKLIPNT